MSDESAEVIQGHTGKSIPISVLKPDDSPAVESIDSMFTDGGRTLDDAAPILRQKHKGGRPPGRKDSKQRRRHGEPEPDAAGFTPGNVADPEPTQQKAKLGDYLEVSKLLAATPFDLAARNTGFEGFKLTTEEIKTLAPPIDAVLVKYFPYLAASAPEMVLAATVLGVVYAKWTEYLEFKKGKNEKNPTVSN